MHVPGLAPFRGRLSELYSIRADKGARKRLVFADFATLPVAGLMVAYAEQTKGLFLLRS